MDEIGGNVTCTLKIKSSNTFNTIGEKVSEWSVYKQITGFLDFSGEETNHVEFKTKMNESTHVFICDYVEIEKTVKELKFLVDNEEYEILYIDNPMGLNEHLEFYLKYIGD